MKTYVTPVKIYLSNDFSNHNDCNDFNDCNDSNIFHDRTMILTTVKGLNFVKQSRRMT
jgi:hypothetical protein